VRNEGTRGLNNCLKWLANRQARVIFALKAQVAPALALHAMDVNSDGNLDIIAAGNLLKMGARFGRATGNFGTVLLGNGHGNFTAMSPRESGLCIRGEVRNCPGQRQTDFCSQ